MSEFKTTIGLEVHASITSAKAKLFSKGENNSDQDEPNSRVDLLDLGLPGALPVLNPEAVMHAVRTCISLNMKINEVFSFDRKIYFYPDLPLGYQITQFFEPIGVEGHLPIYIDEVKRNIRIKQLHMETDVGKSIHHESSTLLDFNRCGSPLMEIVTYPDMSEPDEVIMFVRMLRSTLKHIGVSDATMELGNFRVDVNVSVSNNEILGTRVEIKNLNSYRAIRKAIEAEKERQIQIINSGGKIAQETRSFDEKLGETVFMRNKEDVSDYMYFPEPDLPRFILDDGIVIDQQGYSNNLPYVFLEKLQKRFGVKDNAINLVEEPFVSSFVQRSLEGCSLDEQKQILKLILGEIFARLKEDDIIPISHTNFQKLAKFVLHEQPSATLIKAILDEMWETDSDPLEIVRSKGIEQIKDKSLIRSYIKDVFASSPDEVKRYLAGKKNLRAYFIGQVMKKTNSRVNAAMLNAILDEELADLEQLV